MYEERIPSLMKVMRDLGFKRVGHWTAETKAAYSLINMEYGGLPVHVVHRSLEKKALVHRRDERQLDEPVMELAWDDDTKRWTVTDFQLAQWVVGR